MSPTEAVETRPRAEKAEAREKASMWTVFGADDLVRSLAKRAEEWHLAYCTEIEADPSTVDLASTENPWYPVWQMAQDVYRDAMSMADYKLGFRVPGIEFARQCMAYRGARLAEKIQENEELKRELKAARER